MIRKNRPTDGIVQVMTVTEKQFAGMEYITGEHHSEVISLMEAFLREEDALSRKLFMGRYWHAVSVNDLAKHYALTPNAVTKRLIRTREKLRVYLTERGYRI